MSSRKEKMLEREQKTLSAIQSIEHRDLSSLEIAEFTGKDHKHIMDAVRELVESLKGFSVNGGQPNFRLTSYSDSQGKKQPMYTLDADTALTLLTGYYPKARFALIKRWRELESKDALHKGVLVTSSEGYKTLMSHVLKEVDDKKVSAMKTASIVNKAVSNYFDIPKKIGKEEMSDEMLIVRVEVMKDFETAFQLFKGSDMSVKEFIYKKWQKPQQ